ncbi:MAG TPA: hypothetical protein VKE42_03405, partial [Candidatus Cybelea sp.]|nr:hypothetical protein [Candidatus Cybelea sp.]
MHADVARSRLTDFIALTLLPIGSAVRVAERLRSGGAPGDVLDEVAGFPRGGGAPACELRARAREAFDAARAQGIEPVAWDSASYPVALTTIVDPPPVLWVRGSI